MAQELLPRYLDALITALLGLLQGGQKLVQEGALTAMASVADCAKDNFIKFYDQARARAACPRACTVAGASRGQGGMGVAELH